MSEKIKFVSVIAGLTVVLGSGFAVPKITRATECVQEPDNTKANRQQHTTAEDQKENSADREMARKIRRAIVGDKSLSHYAHNIKIIVRGGKVTLKGPVRNEDEKKYIADKAAEVAGGSDKVENDLTVKL